MCINVKILEHVVSRFRVTFAVFHIAVDYEYELKVQPCDGESSGAVTVSFCPEVSCNTSDVVQQTLTEFDTGMTSFSVQLDFNPTAMQLSASDDGW